MDDLGFGDDVFQLAMISKARKQEIISLLEPLPGHRSKLEDLFLKIENVS
jgi:hypothetical protein